MRCDDGDACAYHDTTCRPVHTANYGRRPQQLASAAGENNVPADYDHLHRREDSDMTRRE